jgi:hypothetical protein
LLLAGQVLVTTPPSVTPPELAVAGGTEALYDVSDDELTLTLSLAVSGFILCFTSPEQSAGAGSFKVPYRYFGFATLAASTGVAITRDPPGRTYLAGTRFATRFTMVTSTGAVSNELFVRGTSQA